MDHAYAPAFRQMASEMDDAVVAAMTAEADAQFWRDYYGPKRAPKATAAVNPWWDCANAPRPRLDPASVRVLDGTRDEVAAAKDAAERDNARQRVAIATLERDNASLRVSLADWQRRLSNSIAREQDSCAARMEALGSERALKRERWFLIASMAIGWGWLALILGGVL